MKEPHPLVKRLYDLARDKDRATLAALRASLSNPLAGLPFVAPFLRSDASRREEAALLLVAGLFALHPAPGEMSLAKALSIVAEESDSVSLRFRALLNSDQDDLPNHLRHAVSLARSRDLSIDYNDLLNAIRWWGSEDKNRQRAWAREFWGTSESGTEEAAT